MNFTQARGSLFEVVPCSPPQAPVFNSPHSELQSIYKRSIFITKYERQKILYLIHRRLKLRKKVKKSE